MEIKQLSKEIPFQWRVQSFSKWKAEATCVAYIDARDVENLLDEVCGAENWQCEYYQVKNTMCCKIGIQVAPGVWVWKSDGGTESDVEKEKGELSDAFKRAAVKWSIGRFLYSKDIVRVPANEKKSDGVWPHVIDNDGQQVWNLTEYVNSGAYKTPPSFRSNAPVKSLEVTPPIQSSEPSKEELNDIFSNAVVPHEEPTAKPTEMCQKCSSPMYYQEWVAKSGKNAGKLCKAWKCQDQQNCKNTRWINS